MTSDRQLKSSNTIDVVIDILFIDRTAHSRRYVGSDEDSMPFIQSCADGCQRVAPMRIKTSLLHSNDSIQIL